MAASVIERNKKVRKLKGTNLVSDAEYGWIDALKKPELIENCVKFGLKKSHSMKMMRSKLKEIHSYQERVRQLLQQKFYIHLTKGYIQPKKRYLEDKKYTSTDMKLQSVATKHALDTRINSKIIQNSLRKLEI